MLKLFPCCYFTVCKDLYLRNLQWNEKLFTMLDFHHNPMGTTKPSEYLNNAASVIYQEYPLALLGQDYLLPSLV